ncbi:patatin-like phospholipase family protein [Engelhardtia mirabilis]|uniref:NTE family protein RssA n=1 Tax=Engelhardtia mirabilis TaxID=2528011 RepID=A0A518BFG1_9BACT|nr:NTE family protein RssA [Planctomycetes bacterium Pla133]QDV00028.1 NTE family protein RssA [Planctomycetes bacterium Pla86]
MAPTPFGLLLALAPLLAVNAQEQERPRIGLVLSGGGARGAAHVGVLQVLEDLHVPVDVVVGTSAGSIVGGLYCAGYTPDDIADIFEQADWPSLLSDEVARDQMWFRRRQDDRRFQVDLELGWRGGAPVLPPGLVLGRNVEAFLERLFLPVIGEAEFDRLRLPFRCVATDLGDGSQVVLDSGRLDRAIRASVSLPGVFAPVVIDGRVLVDGGVVDNIPLDVARALGADVLIVVDIASPLATLEGLPSMVGVSGQVLGILMHENQSRSLSDLGPDDILLEPDLADVTLMQFERSGETIALGRSAAEAIAERLADLALDDAAWERWIDDHRRPGSPPRTIGRVTIAGDSSLSDAIVRELADLNEGDPLEPGTLEAARYRLATLDLFERVDIDIDPGDDESEPVDLVLRPREKSWGPHYLRFGLGVSSDLGGGGDLDLGVQHTWRPVNSLGGEWRNEAQVGTRTRLHTEFYQPLDRSLRWYLLPSVTFEQDDLPVIVEQKKVALVDVSSLGAELALGRNLGDWGALQVGYGYARGELRPEIVVPGLLPGSIVVESGQVSAQLTADTLDRITFPSHGLVGNLRWEYSNDSLGADDVTSTLVGALAAPLSIGQLTFQPSIEAGTTFEGESPIGGAFSLGGFQRLSGLGPQELTGNHYGLGVVQSYYQLGARSAQLDFASFVGVTLEVGGIWQREEEIDGSDLLLGGSLFFAFDTFVGPAYFALGFTEGGERSLNIFVGPTF